MKQFQTNIHNLIIQQQQRDKQKETTSTSSSKSAITWSCNVNMIQVDITNQESIMNWLDKKTQKSKFDSDNNHNNTFSNICIHTAACSNPRVCQDNNKFAYKTNVPIIFFNCLNDYDNLTIHIIALSTDHVYDGTSQLIYEENDDNNNNNQKDNSNNNNNNNDELYDNSTNNNTNNTNNTTDTEASSSTSSVLPKPCNVYGQTKLQMEHILRNLYNEYSSSCNIIILRSSIILGPIVPIELQLSHDTFIHFCYRQLHNKQSTTYYTNEIRNVISIYDVIYTIQYHIMKCINSMQKGKCNINNINDDINNNKDDKDFSLFRIYNMGGPQAVSRYDIAKAVTKYYYYNNNEYHNKKQQSEQKMISTTENTTVTATTIIDNNDSNDDNDNNNLLLLYTKLLIPCEKSYEESYQLGPCPVPLNISMDSTKLYNALNQYNNNKTHHTFRSLDQIIIDTFSSQK